ncbi:hypothetical protein ABB37_06773 [Leptomonas pyrrhocoris]|uniref:LSM domain-containing protein n=1 Tax=Leptomonas pyrrhocoris TaxID=157538 RepID=A0A0N0DTV1_LEPPY|nr:hypothetical protein ABB37_06773 [Leptomonas pyrrhocoris]XP_015656458.1 hypothetical protein ABB37_06773 [Leptomonas pyrrhocoris]KPA78018.1 hypothetical protein ABB37_06773 [Leptomonas pyrrhocoris]KPA78019.1 hypothetical protein ABB37_06773 [Leptomonas pyrrhocoris]|eukprot:XP_015656457.1 hypothetical protein ABB37_06773 [Leptomonas pyrrhocoris]
MSSTAAVTLPGALASGPALHALVRVELTNGTLVVGRLLEMDAATMNVKVDAITSTAVRRRLRRRSSTAAESDVHHGSSASSSAAANSVVAAAAAATAAAFVDTVEPGPIALRCIQGMVIRGACIRFLDFIWEGKDGGTSVGEVEAAARQVRPSE